jgi:hypothetical protein
MKDENIVKVQEGKEKERSVKGEDEKKEEMKSGEGEVTGKKKRKKEKRARWSEDSRGNKLEKEECIVNTYVCTVKVE